MTDTLLLFHQRLDAGMNSSTFAKVSLHVTVATDNGSKPSTLYICEELPLQRDTNGGVSRKALLKQACAGCMNE